MRALVVFGLAAAIMVPATATAHPHHTGSTAVGLWQATDLDRGVDDIPDGSTMYLRIRNNGRFILYDEGASGCTFWLELEELVPATLAGRGVFSSGKQVLTFENRPVFCYPNGLFGGRVSLTPFIGRVDGEFTYDPATNTLHDGTVCWWRALRGSPSDCGH